MPPGCCSLAAAASARAWSSARAALRRSGTWRGRFGCFLPLAGPVPPPLFPPPPPFPPPSPPSSMSCAQAWTSALITASRSLIWASSCAAVMLAATGALAFSLVPSPATSSRLTSPSRAHARTDSGSSALIASRFRRVNSAIVEWSGCSPPQMTRAPTSSCVAISISRQDRRPRQ